MPTRKGLYFSGIRRRPIVDGDAGTINFKLESRLLYDWIYTQVVIGLQKVDYQSVLPRNGIGNGLNSRNSPRNICLVLQSAAGAEIVVKIIENGW